MQVFCRKQQADAIAKFGAHDMTAGDRHHPTGLSLQWQTNFQMINFCEEQQLNALRSLGR